MTEQAEEQRWFGMAWVLWLVPAGAIPVLVAVDPHRRPAAPIHSEAVADWWARQAVYKGSLGFSYLPSFPPTIWSPCLASLRSVPHALADEVCTQRRAI